VLHTKGCKNFCISSGEAHYLATTRVLTPAMMKGPVHCFMSRSHATPCCSRTRTPPALASCTPSSISSGVPASGFVDQRSGHGAAGNGQLSVTRHTLGTRR
jgi:hypothetical protein